MGYALGIDLGTTFTAAAVSIDGRTEVVSLGNHAVTIPSVVFLRDDGEVIVGDVAQRRGQQEPERLAKEFKRRFGDATPIMLGHTPYSAERLMAAVLEQVVGQVAERYGGPADAVAIAHPANWGPYKIELLQQAAQLAGLGAARLVTEPEAAAVHFAAGERLEVGDLVAVYDLGGGTFDAAVLRRTADGFETLGEPQGIERLGGIDFDEAVLSHVRSTLGSSLATVDQSDPAVRSAMTRLREECVSAKEALSEDSETSIPVMLPGLQTQVRLTRTELEDALRPPLRETVASLRRAIDASGSTLDDIKAIVLAGGSSRIPLVNELVSELGRPIALDAHPKHTVALGAARLARLEVAAAGPLPPAVAAPPPAAPPTAPPTPPAGAEPRGGPPGEEPPRRSKALLPLLAIVLVAVVAGLVVLLSGDDDPNDEAGTTTTTVGDTSSSTDGAPTCASSSGRCAVIDDLTADGDEFVVTYSTLGFEPLIDGDDTDHHLHFFFDNVPVEEAGTPGEGPWTIWDLDPEGNKVFRSTDLLPNDDFPTDATELCVVVANHDHSLDDDPQPSCAELP
jgi:actin-like ATPase involved in cell morphogenesis